MINFKFKALFGIEARQVKRSCVMLPMFFKGILDDFGVKGLYRGKLYAAGSSDKITVIQTGIGAGFVGDAVLYLKNTDCKEVILLGSCGLVSERPGLDIGSLVTVRKCYAYESFSDMLLGRIKRPKAYYPDSKFFNAIQEDSITKVTCATLASLKMEEDMLPIFAKKKVDVADMECSAFFAAARKAGIKSSALFYISDIVNKKPFYLISQAELQQKLSGPVKEAVKLALSLIP